MIKNLAVVLFVILAFVLFHAQIKAGVAHARFSLAMSGLELEPEQDEALRSIRDRIGDGLRRRTFTDQERLTLAALRSELGEAGDLDDPAATHRAVDSLIGRFETILDRYGL